MSLFRRLGKAFFNAASNSIDETVTRNLAPQGTTGRLTGWSYIWPSNPKPDLSGFSKQEHDNLMNGTSLGTDRKFFRSAWELMKPYWLSKRGLKGWAFLAGSVALSVANVYLGVLSSEMNQGFIDNVVKAGTTSLAPEVREMHRLAAWGAFGKWVGLVTPAMVFTSVYFAYLQSKLNLDWRQEMTKDFIDMWMDDKTFHRLRSIYGKSENPEQRIEQDVNAFTGKLVDIPLGLMHAGMTLSAFSAVLWGLSDQIQFQIGDWKFTSELHFNAESKTLGAPGYLFIMALAYAVAGTAAVHAIGKKLIDLDRKQEQVNADFRSSMTRVRENSEHIAFFGGEEQEKKRLNAKFRPVAKNWEALIARNKKLGWFKSYYSEASDLFPFLVAAPAVMSGTLSYGQLIQARIAFSRVDYGLQWFVSSYNFIAGLIATTQRLTTFFNDANQSKADYRRTNLTAGNNDNDKPDDKGPIAPAPKPMAP